MLTREHAIAEFDFGAGIIKPDRLTRQTHSHYVAYAKTMLGVYRSGTGRVRRELHQQIRNIFAAEPDCPTRRVDAFCKLLDDASDYHRDSRGKAAQLRRDVFQLAAEHHPLVSQVDRFFESDEHEIKLAIAKKLGRPWSEIDDELFSDVIEFHRLKRFDGYDDELALLARYNVAQVQTALYRAESLTVWVDDEFKTILRYAKLARLMHSIHRFSDGRFRIRLDGPASVLRRTRRYGVAMAKFLPALISCKKWRMQAIVMTRQSWRLKLQLSSEDGLRSHQPPADEFDSKLEQSFAEKWGSEAREGWRLKREGTIFHKGQKAFVPDFVFEHESGLEVPMEIVGFWTPEYLEAKWATLREFPAERILLALSHEASKANPLSSEDVIVFKTVLHVKDVLQRLRAYLDTR